MSNDMNQKTNFGAQDGVDIRELFNVEIKNLKNLIEANDKNYNQRFENVIAATKNALDASDRAISKAEDATEKRFASVNEFRSTLSDQATKFIIRTEFDLVVDRLEQDIKNLVSARSELLATKTFTAAHDSLQSQVDELRLSRATLEGKASMNSVYFSYVIAFVSVIISILSFLGFSK